MNVSEYIIKYLEKKKVDQIFGVVGGAALWICKALSENTYVKPMFTNHEQAATMAADGWARISGKPGFVFTINGPGMTNTVTGIAQAWVDSSPVILLCGNSNLNSVCFERENGMRQYGTQDVRTDEIMKSITKRVFLLDKAEDVHEVIDGAYCLSLEGRPGPVCIEIPINVQSAEVPQYLVSMLMNCSEAEEISRKEITEEQKKKFDCVLDRVVNSNRPLVLAGQGIRLANMVDEFREFVNKFHIPVVNSRMGIDTIETDSELFVGRCGNHGSRASHFAIQTCDTLMILGSRLAPNTTGYDVSKFSNQSYKILVEIDKTELIKKIKIDNIVEEDLRVFLKYAVNEYSISFQNSHRNWINKCNEWKDKYPIMQRHYYVNELISTYRVVENISKASGEYDLILSDTGSCCSIVAQVWNVKKRQRVFISGGLSAMGYWATSMGLASANTIENSNVICFVGDGSLQMNIHELATIKQYNLPIKMIVINNGGYQFVKMSQSGYGIDPPYGTDADNGVPIPNIEAIVEAYKIPYVKCDSADILADTIERFMNINGPVVLEIYVDDNQEVCPRLKSIAKDDGSFVSPEYENLYPYLAKEKLLGELRF